MSNYTAEELDMLGGIKMKIILVVAFIQLIMGVFGNVIIIAIKTKAFVRQSADAMYKVTLAASDSICLGISMVREILYAFNYTDPIDESYLSCALLFVIKQIFQYSSAWILLALNVERCTSITHPLTKHHDWKFALCVSISIVWAFVVSQVAFFFILTMMVSDEGRVRCGVSRTSEMYHRIVYPFFNLAAGCFFPTIGFIVAHVLILKAMSAHSAYIRSTGGRWSGSDQRTHSSDPTPGSKNEPPYSSSTRESSAHSSSGTRGQENIVRGEVETTFKVLLVLDISFFVLILPRDVFVIHHFMSGEGLQDLRKVNTRLNLGLLNLFAHMNNVVNFYLYYALSWTFRMEFKNLFRRDYSMAPSRKRTTYRSSHHVHLAAETRRSVTSTTKQLGTTHALEAEVVVAVRAQGESSKGDDENAVQRMTQQKAITIEGQLEIDDERGNSQDTTATPSVSVVVTRGEAKEEKLREQLTDSESDDDRIEAEALRPAEPKSQANEAETKSNESNQT